MLRSGKQPRAKEAAARRSRPIAVELNFLPDRYRGRGLRILITLRPWLFLAGFALLLIPTVLLYRRQAQDLARVEADLVAVSEALESYQPLADDRTMLETRIAVAQSQIIDIQAAYETIDIRIVTWSELVPRVLEQVPGGIVLSRVSQGDEEIFLEGLSTTYSLPSVLADNLRGLGEFELVTIESVVLEPQEVPAEPVPTTVPASGSQEGAEQPFEEGNGGISDEVPLVATIPESRPPLYRFRISMHLPLPVEATPDSANAGPG